jgi:hypothetical protein
MNICFLPVMTALLLVVSCVTPQHHLSGKTDIQLLLPGEKFDSWKIKETSFDQSRYYMISKFTPAGKSITILASDGEDKIASPDDKTVMIPGIGRVRYRSCSVGGDGEFARFETDPFTRDDGHGGKVYYIVRVNTDDGDQEAMMKSLKWAAPGTPY